MVEYGLTNDEKLVGKQNNTSSGAVKYIDRFDSRGKKLNLKMVVAAFTPLQRLPYSFAQANFHPLTLLT